MSNRYDPTSIESKWQATWDSSHVFEASDTTGKPKKFVLVEFPYPSGAGLHMGHLRPYVAADVYARYMRSRGNAVLFPMGWDAFGLPAENYAIKHGVHPSISTAQNVVNAKAQMRSWGLSFDWSREINTTDPSYYKHTQEIFLELYRAGLGFEATGMINWCPKDKTGLANEEVIDGKCERCGTVVEQKNLRQWYLKITDYAESLLEGLKELPEWPHAVKVQQENWIGKKTGINITYPIEGLEQTVTCFTTRPDTNFGATFIVVGPEHPLLKSRESLQLDDQTWSDVTTYREKAAATSAQDRTDATRKKSGVFTGRYCVNPLNNYRMPLYVGDYVLGNVGTGAVIGVPGHDQRDFEFAQVFGIPVVRVVQKDETDTAPITELAQVQEEDGSMVNSGFLDGMNIHDATEKIMDHMESTHMGKRVVNYRLRDWVFSRQRYWGEPIPLVHCESCKAGKQKVLVVHGFEGSSDGNFIPYLKGELEARGFEVIAPTVQTAAHPTVESWVAELVPILKTFGPNDIVLGHSLGAKMLMHALLEAKITVRHLFVLAGAIGTPPEGKFEAFETEWAGSDIEALKSCWLTPLDYISVGQYATSVTAVRSSDDTDVPAVCYHGLPKTWKIETWNGFGHFDGTQIPEVLSLVLSAKHDGVVPVPSSQLPVLLPEVEKYEPTGTGESPLAGIDSWVNTECPVCGGPAKRETNTMPQWAGSSWYWLRYADPHNTEKFADIEKLRYWQPVDVYFGGMEHTTLHLLYSRFWNHVLHDRGLVTVREPYTRRVPHGIVLAADGEKMSKSRGNVVNPQDYVEKYGADATRMFELFLGPHGDAVAWNDQGMVGVSRFLSRVWDWGEAIASSVERLASSKGTEKVERLLAKLTKKIGEDIEAFRFNTCVSSYMGFLNDVSGEAVSIEQLRTFLLLLSPFAPHICEELNSLVPASNHSLQLAPWPVFDPSLIEDATAQIIIQVGGRVRGNVSLPKESTEDVVRAEAEKIPEVAKFLEGQQIKKVIFVPGRLINFVV